MSSSASWDEAKLASDMHGHKYFCIHFLCLVCTPTFDVDPTHSSINLLNLTLHLHLIFLY